MFDCSTKNLVADQQYSALNFNIYELEPSTLEIPLNTAAELYDPANIIACATQDLGHFDDILSQELSTPMVAGANFDILLAEMFGSELAPLPLDENLNRLPPPTDVANSQTGSTGSSIFQMPIPNITHKSPGMEDSSTFTQNNSNLNFPFQMTTAPITLRDPPERASIAVYRDYQLSQDREMEVPETQPQAKKSAIRSKQSSQRVHKTTANKSSKVGSAATREMPLVPFTPFSFSLENAKGVFKASQTPKRKPFSPVRRQQVADRRAKGACFICRMWKAPVFRLFHKASKGQANNC